MSLSTSQITGSRAAPRDPGDLSGRRPASVFDDRRQYRMAEDSDEDERVPPRKHGALASKNRSSRTKAIHRSFASTPGEARASARSQVDGIVSGGDESDDDFREKIHKELDADRIKRLREMNKQRLEALEQKLLDLHRQKHESDGQSEGEARPAYFRHTKAYKPKTYTESMNQTSEEDGVTTDDGAAGKSISRSAADNSAMSGTESEGPAGYASEPDRARKSMASTGDGARGPVMRMSESAKDISKLYRLPPKKKRAQTKREPFSFDSRIPKPSTRKLKFEQEMNERREQEQAELHKQFTMRPVPKSTTEPLFEKKKQRQEQKSAEIKRQSKEALEASERPFNFWRQQVVNEETELRQVKHKVTVLKEELGHFGVPERSIKRIGKLAWDAIKTDFTEAEQEERRLLLSKVKSKRRLDASERKRLDDLNAEHKKKSESRAFNNEYLRRLSEELDKQKTKFRSVPVPKTIKSDGRQAMETQEAERRYRKEQRANWLRSIAQLPPRMQKHAEEYGSRAPATVVDVLRMRKIGEGDTPTEEHTFRPRAPRHPPDFKRLHLEMRLELAERKLRIGEQSNKANLQPFRLRSEWTELKAFRKYEDRYRKCRVAERVPDFKLKKLELTSGANQWDLIKAVADRNAGEKSQGGKAPDEDTSSHSRWGLTAAEMREFCIKPPSHFVIDAAIEEDIQFLREERWPHSRGGRLQVSRAPVPKHADSSAKPGMTKAQLHRMQHTAKWKEEFERKRLEEAETAEAARKQRQEFWAIKDKVQQALASDVERKRQAAETRKHHMLEQRKDFHNRTAQYKQTLDEKLTKIKTEHKLLMHRSFAKRFQAQAQVALNASPIDDELLERLDQM